MASFSRTTFNAAAYTSARPAYPQALYDIILSYHHSEPTVIVPQDAPEEFLLDVGTGTGTVARALGPHFQRVIGLDVSDHMLQIAKKESKDAKNSAGGAIEFLAGNAGDLGFIAEIGRRRVTCLVAAQAAHWFDAQQFWNAAKAVMATNGTVALWGYKDPVLVDRPEATKALSKWTYDDKRGMGNFWEEPGRTRLRRLLKNENAPMEFAGVKRALFNPNLDLTDEDTHQDGEPIAGTPLPRAWMRQTTTLGALADYVRTYSAFATWKEDNPAWSKSRAEGSEKGDMVDWMIDDMVAAVPDWKNMGSLVHTAKVELVWGTYLILAKKRKDLGKI